MALSKKALQRKREKKKKKRLVRPPSAPIKTVGYNNWPIHECWVPDELWENGLGQIIVSRKKYSDDIAVGVYLIDTFCLGVKNCFVSLMTTLEYQRVLGQVRESCGEMQLVDPVYTNTLINKSIQYANQFGFKPHQDFSKARQFLKDIPVDDSLPFVFGKDGKPYYISGPNESHKEAKRILLSLENIDKNNLIL